MAHRKNVKRIDPRYFLNETVNRNDDGSALEEDVFSAIGDMVSRTGLAGKGAKKELYFRKKGYRLDSKIDDTPWASQYDFARFYEDGDKYDADHSGMMDAWDDYLSTVVKSKARIGKKKNDDYERNKQRGRDEEESARNQAAADREEARKEAERNSPEGRRQAEMDAELRADREKKSRNMAAARGRRERERKSGGDGSWSDEFDFAHQLEEKKKK